MKKPQKITEKEWKEIEQLAIDVTLNRSGYKGIKFKYGVNHLYTLSAGKTSEAITLVKVNGKIQRATTVLLAEIL